MTPNTNTHDARSKNCGVLPGLHLKAASRMLAAPRRTSAVLSVQELRRIVCDMVD